MVEGSVRVTEALPDEFVWAITLVPLVVPLESVPAEVVNRTPAPFVVKVVPAAGVSVTVSGCARAVPMLPVWLLPDWLANLPAGWPTTIHPPCVCGEMPSLPVTV